MYGISLLSLTIELFLIKLIEPRALFQDNNIFIESIPQHNLSLSKSYVNLAIFILHLNWQTW